MTELAYLAASVAGIAIIVTLCAVLFATPGMRLSAAAAEAHLAENLPAFRARATAVSGDGQAALCENALNGAIHLLVVRGDGIVARRLSPGYLTAVARDGAALSLTFADFTLPRIRLSLPGESAMQDWASKLGALACP